MKTWFICKVKYQKQTDEGLLKAVTEPYMVDAVSFTEAEARIYDVLAPEIQGEMLVTGISKGNFTEVINFDDSDKWYKCKVTYISIEGDGGKEKKVSTYFLVSANSLKEAYERVEESLNNMLVPFDIPSIAVTPIIDVFPFMGEDESLAEQARESKEFHERKEAEERAAILNAEMDDKDDDYIDEEDYEEEEIEE